MSRKYKIYSQEKLYFVTFTVIQWMDVFIRKEYKDILLESFKYCQKNKGLEIWAYCIMTSHVHLIIGRRRSVPIEGIIRDIKKYTSVALVNAIKNSPQESRKKWLMWLIESDGKTNGNNKNYQFWQQHSNPIELSNNNLIDRCLAYIHNNPVEAGFVLSAEHYLYSSAVNYAGLPEILLEVELI